MDLKGKNYIQEEITFFAFTPFQNIFKNYACLIYVNL